MYPTTTTDPAARAAFAAGLRALAEFLDAHPALPVPRYSISDGLTVYACGTDQKKRSEVDRIAAILAVKPHVYGCYQAERRFSGTVAYRIVAVPGTASGDQAREGA